MSQAATAWRLAAVAVLVTGGIWGQSTAPIGTDSQPVGWRRLGKSTFNSHLAGPATGPLDSVWYSPDGGTLFVRTPTGKTYQTADFENWTNTNAEAPVKGVVLGIRSPESQAQVVAVSGDSSRAWALGRNLYVSGDGGGSWTAVSGTGGSVIGDGQRDVAVNPLESSAIAVANDSGVWQTQDGGETWAGLNDNLPNLPVARILSTTRGNIRIALNDGRALQMANVREPWEAVEDDSLATEKRETQRLSKLLATEITAWARTSDLAYAGSADGRVWVSRDGGSTWTPPQNVGRGAVRRFAVDADAPRAALAVLNGPGPRVVRTVNTGTVWDDVTGNLGDLTVNAAAIDRNAGVAYLATEKGVYLSRLDLNTFAPGGAWSSVSGSLPHSAAVDISVDAKVGQLFVAVEGYGLYTGPVPVRTGALRVMNAADFSSRAAAPGSLISILGGKVTAASSGELRFPILAAGQSESQLQVPFESRASNLDLAISAAGVSSTLPVEVRSVSPAIFVDHDGYPFLVDADSGLIVDTAAAIHPGTRIQLMVTGLGRVQPDWPTGVPAPGENPPNVVAGVEGFLDGVPLVITKATLAPGYVGYYVVETVLPTVLNAGPAELYLVADGQLSNKVRIQLASQ